MGFFSSKRLRNSLFTVLIIGLLAVNACEFPAIFKPAFAAPILFTKWVANIGVNTRLGALAADLRSDIPGMELVLTGRGATELMTEAADLVTEMREVKHYYSKGVEAREGIET